MVNEDMQINFIRLAHTLERQVFDKAYYSTVTTKNVHAYEIETKVFELLDLFIRDSSLGQFQSRLNFIHMMLDHFEVIAKDTKAKKNEKVEQRLARVINVLDFVLTYYTQFKAKLA